MIFFFVSLCAHNKDFLAITNRRISRLYLYIWIFGCVDRQFELYISRFTFFWFVFENEDEFIFMEPDVFLFRFDALFSYSFFPVFVVSDTLFFSIFVFMSFCFILIFILSCLQIKCEIVTKMPVQREHFQCHSSWNCELCLLWRKEIQINFRWKTKANKKRILIASVERM